MDDNSMFNKFYKGSRFFEGYKFFYEIDSIPQDNPYEENTDEYSEWNEGFESALKCFAHDCGFDYYGNNDDAYVDEGYDDESHA